MRKGEGFVDRVVLVRFVAYSARVYRNITDVYCQEMSRKEC